jgi:RimJ/RimL family protein N-acetyltransferase
VPRSELEEPDVSVRVAMPADVPWLMEQLRAFDRFFGAARPLYPGDEQARRFLDHAVGDWGAFLFLVAEHDRAPVGFIAGAFHQHLFNPRIRQLTELFWWVAVEYRGTTAGARLLQRYVELGRSRADWIVMSLEAKSPVNPRALERLGFQPYETSYLLEVSHDGSA